MVRAVSAAELVENETSATGYYQAELANRQWVITRHTDGHVLCLCRSQLEAQQIAGMMNRDYASSPQHHGGS
jgi:hypothetical protein